MSEFVGDTKCVLCGVTTTVTMEQAGGVRFFGGITIPWECVACGARIEVRLAPRRPGDDDPRAEPERRSIS